MSAHHYIACDLGAESGRVVLGRLDASQVTLQEIHRFPNGGVKIAGSLRWNILSIFAELKIGLRKVAASGVRAESLSVDSWGLDYVFIGAGQPLLSLPDHYRDARAPTALLRRRAKIPRTRTDLLRDRHPIHAHQFALSSSR